MRRRGIVIAAAAIATLVAWYLFRPELLFIDREIHEEFPAGADEEMPKAASDSHSMAAPREAVPVTTLLAAGDFHAVAHHGEGRASIYKVSDGGRVLRLTDFATSNGPDLFVYLVAADDARDNATVKNAGFVSLGRLKGNVGEQNYDVPADLDLEKYRSATIWCRRFGVNFATAPLAARN